MAGEFHDDLGGDADGEHEADEGLAAGVSADRLIFWVHFIVTGAVAVASDGVADGGDVTLAAHGNGNTDGLLACKDSLEFLLSDEGKAAIVQLHVDGGIIAYIESQNQD